MSFVFTFFSHWHVVLWDFALVNCYHYTLTSRKSNSLQIQEIPSNFEIFGKTSSPFTNLLMGSPPSAFIDNEKEFFVIFL